MRALKAILAIDPGKNGGVAVINCVTDGPPFQVRLYNCPSSPKKMVSLLKSIKVKYKKVDTIMEQVWGFPSDASSAAFKFGQNYGQWIGILSSLGMKYEEVPPQRWQKKYSPLPKKKSERKKKLNSMAKEISSNATLKTCDALLIAMYKLEEETNGKKN